MSKPNPKYQLQNDRFAICIIIFFIITDILLIGFILFLVLPHEQTMGEICLMLAQILLLIVILGLLVRELYRAYRQLKIDQKALNQTD